MNNILYKTCKNTPIYSKKKKEKLNDLIRSRMEG